MDISNWGIGQIMMLPDHLFGRRWLLGCSAAADLALWVYDISEMALPEWCVIWEMVFTGCNTVGVSINFSLRLGDQLPASDAEFLAMEMIFPGIDHFVDGRNVFELGAMSNQQFRRIRQPVHSMGRRLVMGARAAVGSPEGGSVQVLISSVPKEIPEWFRLA